MKRQNVLIYKQLTEGNICDSKLILKLFVIMLPNIGLIVVFCSGLAFAAIFTLLPEIIRLIDWKNSQFNQLSTWGINTASELATSEGPGSQISRRGNRHIALQGLKTLCSVHPEKREVENQSAMHETVDLQQKKSKKSKTSSSDLTAEAVAALKQAMDVASHGKHEKAEKLFQHALNLDPTNADILNKYGEFLEKRQKDILFAEQMYCKALINSPKHSQALQNRKRTLPIVEEIDQNSFNRIEKKREMFFQIPEMHPGLRRMKKEAYFKHLYHTTAIEGNTFTLTETRVLVETRLAVNGKSIIEHNEILGVDSALSYINSTLLNRIGSITVDDILDIHKRVLGFVDPLEAGQFRNTQVYVGDYIPPPASEVKQLMKEFVTWLNTEEALNLNPIELAALAHYRLVFIHPFYDGNGRTARLLMNLILMQAGYPPVTIKVEEKHEYYQYLDTGNNGDIRPFIRFIARCTERTLDEYLWAVSDRPGVSFPGLTSPMYDGRTIYVGDSGAE